MKTRFIDKDDFTFIYEVDVVMILEKGAKLLIKGQDYVVESSGVVLGELDRIEIIVSEVDYTKPIITKDTKLIDSGLSPRIINCLRQYDIHPEEKLEVFSRMRGYELPRLRNFGQKSLEEVKALCKKANITMLP